MAARAAPSFSFLPFPLSHLTSRSSPVPQDRHGHRTPLLIVVLRQIRPQEQSLSRAGPCIASLPRRPDLDRGSISPASPHPVDLASAPGPNGGGVVSVVRDQRIGWSLRTPHFAAGSTKARPIWHRTIEKDIPVLTFNATSGPGRDSSLLWSSPLS
ncbi:hypothetical protein D1007_17055 [Hordeum vulgare]|nr:hypothetical protein D1007_17055 [Hordeum vulgare]